MKLLFTRNNQIFSRLLRFLLKEDCSHFAIMFDNKFIIHSNFLGVKIDWAPYFLQHSEIVHELTYAIHKDYEEDIYTSILNISAGKSYDFLGLAYIGYRILLQWLFNIPISQKNRWAKNNNYICTEMALLLPVQLPDNVDMLTPHQLYECLKNGYNQISR